MLVGNNGEVYLLWQEGDNGSDIHFASTADTDEGFSDPVNFSEDTVIRSGSKIAGTTDRLFIVWVESNDILVANGTIDNDGNVEFGSAVNLSTNTGESRNPQIVASANSVYVVWEDNTDLSSTDIFYSFSVDGQAFSTPSNLSPTDSESLDPRVAVSETRNVYVAWQDEDPGFPDGRAIFVKASTDDGFTFGDHTTVNSNEGTTSDLDLVPYSSNEIALVWADGNAARDVHFSLGTVNESDNSIYFGNVTNVSNNDGSSTSVALALSNMGTIYVAWIDDTDGTNNVLISNSTDGGVSFSMPIAATSDASAKDGSLVLLAPPEGENVYLIWHDNSVGNGDIFISEVKESGHDLGTPTNISGNSGNSQQPQVGAFKDDIYVAWQDDTPGNNEILFTKVSTAPDEDPVVDIFQPANESAKWGRSIEISGTTNGGEEDVVSIDWGDGSEPEEVGIADSSWGPVEHVYDASSVGSNLVVASLLDSSGNIRATSEPVQITVLKHDTVVAIEELSAVAIEGEDIIFAGVLTDTDDDVGIEDAAISFNGTGSEGLQVVMTAADGSYSGTGPVPGSASSLWTISAVFDGDSKYAPSTSHVHTFDTVSSDSASFTIMPGAPSVLTLDGFNASIVFDEIVTEETLFVSECDTPYNPRYMSIGLCFALAMTGSIPEGSFAHLTFSYAGRSIPDEHSHDEVDVFHETVEGYVDITEARDIGQQTVKGRTSDFSRFIVAVAVHEEQESDAVRKQVFVGHNDVIFNALSPRTITLDSPRYSIGSTVRVTVEDETVSNPGEIDTITINVTSDSDRQGITISANETGIDTGTFEGEVTLSADSSSIHNRILHAAPGDTISGVYLSPAKGPFRIILDDVNESGMLEVKSSAIDRGGTDHIPDFDAISESYKVTLIDGQLANGSEVTVIMSYANVDLRNNEIISVDKFRVLQLDPMSPASGAFEWFDIAGVDSAVIDTGEKTVTGKTTFLSNFTIGHDVRISDPGGTGGGPVKSGIIVLDAIASVRDPGDDDDNSGGNGNRGRGGSKSTTISPAPAGDDVETSVRTDAGTVTFKFESVDQENSQVRVALAELSEFAETFDKVMIMPEDNDEHGRIDLEGETYYTVGDVFDISVSLGSKDRVLVTVPYDEEVIDVLGPESALRFLHYNEALATWEDKTETVDEAANTVTGALNSLSPVIIAIAAGDETDTRDSDAAGLTGLRIDTPDVAVETGSMTLSATIQSTLQADQDYVLVVQVLDESNIVHYVDWQVGSIESNGESRAFARWDGAEKGQYRLQILLLSDMENPRLLSKVVQSDLLL
jgi:hypothetical protein